MIGVRESNRPCGNFESGCLTTNQTSASNSSRSPRRRVSNHSLKPAAKSSPIHSQEPQSRRTGPSATVGFVAVDEIIEDARGKCSSDEQSSRCVAAGQVCVRSALDEIQGGV